MQQAVTENRALLIPGSRRQDGKKVVVTTMVAPILAGGRANGIVALQTETPRGVYDERDLEYLVLLARHNWPPRSARWKSMNSCAMTMRGFERALEIRWNSSAPAALRQNCGARSIRRRVRT